MERSCTVNLLTKNKNKNKKHFHGKELHCKPSSQKQTLSWKGVAL